MWTPAVAPCCCACGRPVPHLLTRYGGGRHVVLTPCDGPGGCGAPAADPYLEVDSVVLALDLLLLRPAAFRHALLNRAGGGGESLRRLCVKAGLSVLALDAYSAAFAATHAWPPPASHLLHGAPAPPAAERPWLRVDPLRQHASLRAVLSAGAGADPRTHALLAARLARDSPWLLTLMPPPPPPVAPHPRREDAGCEELLFHCGADRCTLPVRLTGSECEAHRAEESRQRQSPPPWGSPRPLAHHGGKGSGVGVESSGAAAGAAALPAPADTTGAVLPRFLPLLLPAGAVPPGWRHGAATAPARLHLFLLAVCAAVGCEWAAHVGGTLAVLAAARASGWWVPPPGRRHHPPLTAAVPALLLGSFGKALLLPSMVWAYPPPTVALNGVYVLMGQAVSLHTVCGVPWGAAVGAVAAGAAAAMSVAGALQGAGWRPLAAVAAWDGAWGIGGWGAWS